MKLRTLAVAVGLALTVCGARANSVLLINETGGNFEGLVVKFNGLPGTNFGIQITGQADNWLITLPQGWGFYPTVVVVGEPEDPNTVNLVSIFGGRQLAWPSELPPPPPPPPGGYPTSVKIRNGGLTDTLDFFDLVLADTSGSPSVPDSGSSAALLGAAVTILVISRRFYTVRFSDLATGGDSHFVLSLTSDDFPILHRRHDARKSWSHAIRLSVARGKFTVAWNVAVRRASADLRPTKLLSREAKAHQSTPSQAPRH